MFIIPEKVQILSIENTSTRIISIQACSADYDQLGYFIATLKTKGILKNVVSSTGNKSGDTVTVTIEGELP
jgi:Tfp pilus assembly protein PilN